MTYNHGIHHRRSIRLKEYDYSEAGAYFVTICTQSKECLFGNVVNGTMQLHDMGIVARQCWNAIPQHFLNVLLDEFVVMPNHIHGIVIFNVGAKNISPGLCDNVDINRSKNISPGLCDNVDINRSKNISPGPCDNVDINRAKNNLSGPCDNVDTNRAKNISPLQYGTSMTIGSVIRGFKIGVTKWARATGACHTPWQRNYYEHIIRNEHELHKIREYIINNPLNWEKDENFM